MRTGIPATARGVPRAVARAAALPPLVAVALLVSSAGAPAAPIARVPATTRSATAAVRTAASIGPNSAIGFRLFPSTSPWNADVSTLPVDPASAEYLASIGLDTSVHPDFGTVWAGAPNGIQFITVHGSQPEVPVSFYYGDESDPGPYPIPADAPIEGGPAGTGDRHVIVLDVDDKRLYEVFDAHYDAAHGRWNAGSGAIWDVAAESVRPDGWTSADAAGLPILPGLVRYDEVASGEIAHALRFTVPRTRRSYRYPASHFASNSDDPSLPPMGLRVRLKAGYDISRFPAHVQVILRALKKYGMIVADNGSPWYISGAPDPRWDDGALHAIQQVTGRDFEAVDTRSLEPSAPLVSAGRSGPLPAGGLFDRWGCFADPRGASWTATVDYGDGAGTVPLTIQDAQRFHLSHRYANGFAHRVTVRVRNDRGATGSAILTVGISRHSRRTYLPHIVEYGPRAGRLR